MQTEPRLHERGRTTPRQAEKACDDLAERLMDIGRRCAALPDVDPRPADEIIAYDEHGVPL